MYLKFSVYTILLIIMRDLLSNESDNIWVLTVEDCYWVKGGKLVMRTKNQVDKKSKSFSSTSTMYPRLLKKYGIKDEIDKSRGEIGKRSTPKKLVDVIGRKIEVSIKPRKIDSESVGPIYNRTKTGDMICKDINKYSTNRFHYNDRYITESEYFSVKLVTVQKPQPHLSEKRFSSHRFELGITEDEYNYLTKNKTKNALLKTVFYIDEFGFIDLP